LLPILDQLHQGERKVGIVINRVVPFDAESITQAERDNASKKFYGKVVVEISKH